MLKKNNEEENPVTMVMATKLYYNIELHTLNGTDHGTYVLSYALWQGVEHCSKNCL